MYRKSSTHAPRVGIVGELVSSSLLYTLLLRSLHRRTVALILQIGGQLHVCKSGCRCYIQCNAHKPANASGSGIVFAYLPRIHAA